MTQKPIILHTFPNDIWDSYGRFILGNAACGYIDATDHTLLASCTRSPFLDAKGNARVFALFAEADDSSD